MSCPIPLSVLHRRPGRVVRYRHHASSFWGSCGDDPKRECPAGRQSLYEVQTQRRGPGRPRTTWVYHDQHSGGARPFYDRWTVYNALPDRLTHSRIKPAYRWHPYRTPHQEWQSTVRREQEAFREQRARVAMLKAKEPTP